MFEINASLCQNEKQRFTLDCAYKYVKYFNPIGKCLRDVPS